MHVPSSLCTSKFKVHFGHVKIDQGSLLEYDGDRIAQNTMTRMLFGSFTDLLIGQEVEMIKILIQLKTRFFMHKLIVD